MTEFKEICEALLARQSTSVHLPLFLLVTNTLHFHQTFESTSSLPSSTRYSNHNISELHANYSQVSRRDSSLQG